MITEFGDGKLAAKKLLLGYTRFLVNCGMQPVCEGDVGLLEKLRDYTS